MDYEKTFYECEHCTKYFWDFWHKSSIDYKLFCIIMFPLLITLSIIFLIFQNNTPFNVIFGLAIILCAIEILVFSAKKSPQNTKIYFNITRGNKENLIEILRENNIKDTDAYIKLQEWLNHECNEGKNEKYKKIISNVILVLLQSLTNGFNTDEPIVQILAKVAIAVLLIISLSAIYFFYTIIFKSRNRRMKKISNMLQEIIDFSSCYESINKNI